MPSIFSAALTCRKRTMGPEHVIDLASDGEHRIQRQGGFLRNESDLTATNLAKLGDCAAFRRS